MSNRLSSCFEQNTNKVLNVYFTAGYPELQDTMAIIEALEAGGADLIEIGIPFSDPIADGPTIQESNMKALENGMEMSLLFDQLAGLRPKVGIPVFLMGYLNPVLQYGFEAFCSQCSQVGIDGLILPDMPLYEYEEIYQPIYRKYGLSSVFLITPETTEERVRKIASLSSGFVYMVSSSSTTGKTKGFSEAQQDYFKRIGAMSLQRPVLTGFGISDQATFQTASQFVNGAIVGSAFIRHLGEHGTDKEKIKTFISSIKG
jgi:tryptophan synthase alpha chain